MATILLVIFLWMRRKRASRKARGQGGRPDTREEAIAEQVNNSRKNCSRMDKPAPCNSQLVAGKNYHLTSEPEGKVEPSELNFNIDVIGLKGFSEARFDERPPFRLFLRASVNKKIRNCDKPLWSATIIEGNQWTQFEFVLWFAS
ncbi:unnamed protein product [Arctogadus glacialis]